MNSAVTFFTDGKINATFHLRLLRSLLTLVLQPYCTIVFVDHLLKLIMAGVTPGAYLNVLKSGQFSDLTISCQDAEFKVHRVVVCSASSMLNAACNGSFQVTSSADCKTRDVNQGYQEATSRKVNFPEDDPQIMSRVVLFLYTSDYDANSVPTFILPGQNQGSKSLATVQQAGQEIKPSTTPESPATAETPPAKRQKTSAATATPATAQVPMNNTTALPPGIFETLKTNALVYKCADMLGIENLKVLAADRFMADARVAFSEMGFAEPLRILYQSTRSDDELLRVPVTTLCVENHELVERIADTVGVMEQYEYCAWKIMPLLKAAHGREVLKDTIERVNKTLKKGCSCSSSKYWITKYSLDADGSVKGQCSHFCCDQPKI